MFVKHDMSRARVTRPRARAHTRARETTLKSHFFSPKSS